MPVTMPPAIHMPIKINSKACLNSTLKIVAASEPVQAPVIGRGTATNKAKPMRLYLSTIPPRRLVRSSSQLNQLLKIPILLRRREIVFKNNKIRICVIKKSVYYFFFAD